MTNKKPNNYEILNSACATTISNLYNRLPHLHQIHSIKKKEITLLLCNISMNSPLSEYYLIFFYKNFQTHLFFYRKSFLCMFPMSEKCFTNTTDKNTYFFPPKKYLCLFYSNVIPCL